MLEIVAGQHVLDRGHSLAAAFQPGGSATMQRRYRFGLSPHQLGAQGIAKQVVVAVPLASPVKRHNVEIRPL